MNALKPRPPFQGFIMSEESHLGRKQIETAHLLKQIIDAGVRVFFCLGAVPTASLARGRLAGSSEAKRCHFRWCPRGDSNTRHAV